MADTITQVPEGEKAEGEHPRPEYDIVPSQRQEPESSFVVHQFYPNGTPSVVNADSPREPDSDAQLGGPPRKLNQKSAADKTKMYAATAVGLGILAGLIFAFFLSYSTGQDGSNDMGAVTAKANGLKGHLTVKWGDRLSYRLTVEPSDPGQYKAFLSAVHESPRPLSVSIQLKDSLGSVLCGNTILLKYDPRKADLGLGSSPTPKNKRAAEELAVRNQIALSLNLARLESQELDREHGKDVFQDDIGADGKLTSISAQGVLPCAKKQYDNVASWSFKNDFPTVAVTDSGQGGNPNGENGASAGADGKATDASKLSADKKARKQPLPQAPRIYIEGDDAIVWYDASAGIVETSAGKALQVDRMNAGINTLKGREFPVDIHYQCDQAGNCTFAGIGLGVQHARLRQ